ncbi:MAG: zinc-binding dehydrogenase [Candidatus Dormiibacterota bacterium]
MLAVQFVRSPARYGLVRASGGNARFATGELSMLHFGDLAEPRLPAPSWVRVRPRLSGICGSDLAAITGHASIYLAALTSYPFVPGHEVVGEVDGERVVVEPALGCEVRGIAPPCPRCLEGRPALCEHLTEGDLAIGMQTGYCESTGGGWGEELVAHPSQVHPVPAALPDEAAVLIEPFACAVHATLRGRPGPDETVLVNGAGTIGLLTTAAVRTFATPRQLIVVAKHPRQRELAKAFGADLVISPSEIVQRLRFHAGAHRVDGPGGSLLLGGAEVTFECTGTAGGLSTAARVTRAGGRLVAVGMPGEVKVDWGPIWQRELSVLGAYAYGREAPASEGEPDRRTFALALDAAPGLGLERLAGPLFELAAYRDAIEYASEAGRLGAVKVAFDLRVRSTG